MMQNSPLLVSPVNPVNKTNALSKESTQQEASEPFEQVLSKQVKKEQPQAKAEAQSNDGDNIAVAENAEADVLLDSDAEVVDVAEEGVDAQLLAQQATAKTLKEVTEGEVTIDSATAQGLPGIQAAIQALQAAGKSADAGGLRKGNHVAADSGVTMTTPKVSTVDTELSTENVTDDQQDLVSNQLQAKPLKDAGETLQAKFANAIAAEGKQQAFADALAERTVKAPAEVAALSLPTSVAKPTIIAEPAALQMAGASHVMNTAPGKTGWNEAISQKVMWMVGASEQSATLTLNPKDLGPLQVIINVNNEKADATFISENPEVRKALEEGMSSLRNSMGQAGVELGQANVNTSKQHQEFQQASQERAATHTEEGATLTGDEGHAGATLPTRVSNGLVDTFA